MPNIIDRIRERLGRKRRSRTMQTKPGMLEKCTSYNYYTSINELQVHYKNGHKVKKIKGCESISFKSLYGSTYGVKIARGYFHIKQPQGRSLTHAEFRQPYPDGKWISDKKEFRFIAVKPR